MKQAQGDETATLCEQLTQSNLSIGFLLIIIASILISYLTAVTERNKIALALCGKEACLPDTYPARKKASAMIVGALGFFLCLALHTAAGAEDLGAVERRSANVNVCASLLVLLAAILRLLDLEAVHCSGDAALPGEIDQPD